MSDDDLNIARGPFCHSGIRCHFPTVTSIPTRHDLLSWVGKYHLTTSIHEIINSRDVYPCAWAACE